MPPTAIPTPRFLRKTTLADNEYRRNFRQIDNDVIDVITSPEADAVTPLMSKIYLRLMKAPDMYVESAGVLRFEEEVREGKRRTAWQVFCNLLNVSSSTANKAVKFMAEMGLIGYWSGKNGVGLRIFLNRASSSIGTKPQSALKKILPFSPAPSGDARASSGEAGFSGSFAEEDLDLNSNSRSPDGGADRKQSDKISAGPAEVVRPSVICSTSQNSQTGTWTPDLAGVNMEQFVRSIVALIEPRLHATMQSATRHAIARQQEATRDWMEKSGLPKVARVAQREAYNILRQHGIAADHDNRARSQLQVGASPRAPLKPEALSPSEIEETAQYCVLCLQTRGQAIDVTLAEISAEAGGFLLAEDAPKVRELAEAEARARLLEAKEAT